MTNSNEFGRSDDEVFERETSALEAKLAALVPRADRLDRERLIFLAGRASLEADRQNAVGVRGGWSRYAWPASFATMSGIAAALLVMVIQLRDRDGATAVRVDRPEVSLVGPRVAVNGDREASLRNVMSPGDLLRVDAALIAATGSINSQPKGPSTPPGGAIRGLSEPIMTPALRYQMDEIFRLDGVTDPARLPSNSGASS